MADRVYLKNRFFISAIIFGVLALVIAVLVAYPALREIRTINRQVYEERVRLEKLYVKGQLQKKVRENYARIEGSIGFLDEILLQENNELPYIAAVEQAASDAGAELKINIGERKRQPNELISSLRFNLEVKGSWESIARFLESLEKMPWYSNIQESTFAVHQEKDNSSRIISASLAVDTFWLLAQ